jgi:hypothetical protein
VKREMTIVYAPDEEKRKIRKKLEKLKKAEKWRTSRPQYGTRDLTWQKKMKKAEKLRTSRARYALRAVSGRSMRRK